MDKVETKSKPSATAEKIAHREEQLKMALSLARGNFPAIKTQEDRLLRIAACIERALRIDSAAPELLEACKKIRNATHPTSDYFEIVNRAIVKVEGHKPGTVAAAIAKVEGK